MLQAGGRALLFGDRGDDTHGVLFSGLLDAGELSLLDEMEVQCIVDAVYVRRIHELVFQVVTFVYISVVSIFPTAFERVRDSILSGIEPCRPVPSCVPSCTSACTKPQGSNQEADCRR